ncbi:MAG: carboxymuconolactone decarboxylase family protein [Promethearchaeota archaeon]
MFKIKKEIVNQTDIDKIEKIIRDRKLAHTFLLANKSKVYKAFLDMEEATYSDGALEKRIKELIAIGISIVINCESCLEWHIHEALKSGATKAQIIEAIEVGIEMSGGPGTVSSRFAFKVLEYYTKNDSSNRR